jgi:hypothetical protein
MLWSLAIGVRVANDCLDRNAASEPAVEPQR